MSDPRVYLDHNATSPLRPEATEAVKATVSVAGNPSSVHADGRAARRIVEEARRAVAALVGAAPANVVFTSSGSEGAATLLAPGFQARGGAPAMRLIVSAVEHSCVVSGGRFPAADVTICQVDTDGIIDLEALSRLLEADRRPALVALMAANNETGVLQPVADAARIAHAHGAAIICDAVQAVGKCATDLAALGVDALFLSGHKLGAPQGVGAIALAPETTLVPLMRGGAQEGRKRAGTENLLGIAGLGAVARVLAVQGADEVDRISTLRGFLERSIRSIYEPAVILAGSRSRLPNTCALLCPTWAGETAVIAFDLAGVSIATGSACASGKISPSHVTRAMGLDPDAARSVIRISLGWSTSEDDVARFLEVFAAHAARVSKRPVHAA
jgi:cysteine desulfurase